MEGNLEYGKDYKYIPMTSFRSGLLETIAADLYCLTVQIVNVCFIGNPKEKDQWVLIDAGTPKSENKILTALKENFGSIERPKAIILTHGHFDHVGSIIELIQRWDVPVYAHELELPFLTGRLKYPEPDASVEGGILAKIAAYYPNEPIYLGKHVLPLPSDGSIPDLPDWRWIHTPGHTPGHISLFREEDRSLVAGDAFVTVKQEYVYDVLTQEQTISGPPRYFTPDWQASWESVKRLHKLEPAVAITGHGIPLEGKLLTESLETLVQQFDQLAIPKYGRFVEKQ